MLSSASRTSATTAAVRSIRRYPVKSMGGESLAAARMDARGIRGDRWFAVRDADGHLASAKNSRRFRRHDAVFGFTATTEGEGRADEVVVSSGLGRWRVGDPALDARVSATLGVAVNVVPELDVPHFDAGAVSLVGTATLDWCAHRFDIDADPRRLRVNLLIETDEPFVEESWIGRTLAIGSAILRVVERVERCRTVDVAQDGVAHDAAAPDGTAARGRWLKPLAAERDMCVAVYADVAAPGELAVGDPVLLT